MKKRALFLSLLSLAFIAGCGENSFEGQEDKNSTEAKQFDISAQLDAGNYGEILAHPEDVNATDYAAAAMGAAGLDPVDLIKAMNEAATAGTTSDLSAVTALSIDPDALQYLQAAEELLSSERDAACSADANSQECQDLNFQVTLTSLTSTVTAMAQLGQNYGIAYTDSDGGESTFDATDGISEAEATALGEYITNNPETEMLVDTDGDTYGDTSLVDVVAGDIVNIIDALPNAGLGDTSELSEVLTDATTGPEGIDPGGDGVSPTDVSNYLTSVLGQE